MVEFAIGGLSGVTHAVSPSDTQRTDTYYIVAHIHYVLFGGTVLGFFAAFYYWWPKIVGVIVLAMARFGWALEPSVEPGSDDNPPVVGPGVDTQVATVDE